MEPLFSEQKRSQPAFSDAEPADALPLTTLEEAAEVMVQFAATTYLRLTLPSEHLLVSRGRVSLASFVRF